MKSRFDSLQFSLAVFLFVVLGNAVLPYIGNMTFDPRAEYASVAGARAQATSGVPIRVELTALRAQVVALNVELETAVSVPGLAVQTGSACGGVIALAYTPSVGKVVKYELSRFPFDASAPQASWAWGVIESGEVIETFRATDKDLLSDVAYKYQIHVVGTDSEAYSAIASAASSASCKSVAGKVTVSVATGALCGGTLDLKYSGLVSGNKYELQRMPDPTGKATWFTLATDDALPAQDLGLVPEAVYMYQIISRGGQDSGQASAVVSAPASRICPPTNFIAACDAKDPIVHLKWDPLPASATGFRLFSVTDNIKTRLNKANVTAHTFDHKVGAPGIYGYELDAIRGNAEDASTQVSNVLGLRVECIVKKPTTDPTQAAMFGWPPGSDYGVTQVRVYTNSPQVTLGLNFNLPQLPKFGVNVFGDNAVPSDNVPYYTPTIGANGVQVVQTQRPINDPNFGLVPAYMPILDSSGTLVMPLSSSPLQMYPATPTKMVTVNPPIVTAKPASPSANTKVTSVSPSQPKSPTVNAVSLKGDTIPATPTPAPAQNNVTDDNNGLIACGNRDINGDGMIKDVPGGATEECHFDDFLVLVNKLVSFMIVVGTSIAVLAFAYSGFLMLTSTGEAGKIAEAKAIFGKVLIGFLVMIAAWAIVHLIEATLVTGTGFFSFLK